MTPGVARTITTGSCTLFSISALSLSISYYYLSLCYTDDIFALYTSFSFLFYNYYCWSWCVAWCLLVLAITVWYDLCCLDTIARVYVKRYGVTLTLLLLLSFFAYGKVGKRFVSTILLLLRLLQLSVIAFCLALDIAEWPSSVLTLLFFSLSWPLSCASSLASCAMMVAYCVFSSSEAKSKTCNLYLSTNVRRRDNAEGTSSISTKMVLCSSPLFAPAFARCRAASASVSAMASTLCKQARLIVMCAASPSLLLLLALYVLPPSDWTSCSCFLLMLWIAGVLFYVLWTQYWRRYHKTGEEREGLLSKVLMSFISTYYSCCSCPCVTPLSVFVASAMFLFLLLLSLLTSWSVSPCNDLLVCNFVRYFSAFCISTGATSFAVFARDSIG